ncbi:hypothetical protein Peur_021648 [Populus x canadensis]
MLSVESVEITTEEEDLLAHSKNEIKNCRGALSSRFCSIVHDLRKVYGFDILALAKPRMSCREQKKLLRSWALRIIIEQRQREGLEVFGCCATRPGSI